jgi:hypothetical protein
MTDLLDISLRDLFAPDPDHRRLLHQVVESVQLDQGISYMDALERVHEASEGAHNDGKPTLRGALEWIRADGSAVVEHVKLLDQRDAAVGRAHKNATSKQSKLKRDPFGRVRLDQSYKKRPKSLDADGRLMDPAEFEDRLSRARKVDPRYAGDQGRAAFRFDDSAHLAGHVDLVRTLELAVEEQAAGAKAGEVARLLDQEVAAAADKRRELKLLDGQIDELQSQRDKLEPQADAAGQRLRMLDQATASKPKKKKQLTEIERRQEKLGKRVRKRMRRLGLPERDYVVALEAEIRGDPMPPKTPKAPDAPHGVLPGSHDLHQRIEQYMLDNELPKSAYPKVLEQVVTGQVRL